MFILACQNSDGLTQFTWSHEGYWQSDMAGHAKKDTIFECAETCLEDDECVAISYYPGSQECHYWNDIDGSNTIKRSEFKAYIRCSGISG